MTFELENNIIKYTAKCDHIQFIMQELSRQEPGRQQRLPVYYSLADFCHHAMHSLVFNIISAI